MNYRHKHLPGNTLAAYATTREEMNDVRRFAYRQGIKIGRRFYETTADCGKTLSRRPKLVGVFAEAKASSIEKLLIHSWTNFDGNPQLRHELIKYLRELSVEVIVACPNDDVEDVSRELKERGVVRELRLFKQAVSRKVSGTQLGRRATTRRPEEMRAVTRIIELAKRLPKNQLKRRAGRTVTRRSPGEIARRLADEGITRSDSRPWTDDAVRTVLERERPEWLERRIRASQSST